MTQTRADDASQIPTTKENSDKASDLFLRFCPPISNFHKPPPYNRPNRFPLPRSSLQVTHTPSVHPPERDSALRGGAHDFAGLVDEDAAPVQSVVARDERALGEYLDADARQVLLDLLLGLLAVHAWIGVWWVGQSINQSSIRVIWCVGFGRGHSLSPAQATSTISSPQVQADNMNAPTSSGQDLGGRLKRSSGPCSARSGGLKPSFVGSMAPPP